MQSENSIPEIHQYPIPSKEGGPVFNEPWEAQIFAMTVHLNETGHFTWTEWANRFGQVIRENRESNPDKTYYENWLETLERMLASKEITPNAELEKERQAWRVAAQETPHGEPIELARAVGKTRSNLNEKRL